MSKDNTKASGPVQAPTLPASTKIKARVRPFNKYAGHKAGDVLEVEPRELIVAKHALISLEAEALQAAEIEQAKEAQASVGNLEFRQFRKQSKMAFEAQKQAAAIRLQQQAEDINQRAKLIKE